MAPPTTQPAAPPAPPRPGTLFPRPPGVWRAPLVPVALAVTAGIILDRYASVPIGFSLAGAAVTLAAWAVSRRGRPAGLPLVYLAAAGVAVGAAHHHRQRDVYLPDDIGTHATTDPRPCRLRGVLAEEPAVVPQPPDEPLRSIPHPEQAVAVVRAESLMGPDGWVPVSGRARLAVAGHLPALHVGDEVEVTGRIELPHGPANPGEGDFAGYLRDRRIRAVVSVHKTPDGVVRLAEGWPRTLDGWLAVVRGWGQRVLARELPAEQAGVGMALLLGEGAPVTNADWEKYIQTGVIHVLAISGQHLVVLGGFLWLVLRLLGVRRRTGAVGVALFLLAYALLAGGRPPVMRSAVAVCAACGATMLRRPPVPANWFALSWLVVAALNPTDLAGAGCQLSFLAVAVLYWGARWPRRTPDPLDRLADAARPLWQRLARRLARHIALAYAVTALVWLAAAPLVAANYHLVSPVALVLGPPVVWATSMSLIAGFLLLIAAAVCPPLAPVFALPTRWGLAVAEYLVHLAQGLPAGHWYVADVPEWWLWVFYAGLLAFLVTEPLRQRWRWVALASLVWLCVGLAASALRPRPDELRCTFLAVGHGGCTVIETPDGRVLLYDAGSLAGPDVARRQIAPFLWSRGVRRIDEILLSHADLDHFNGLPQLLERFTVAQVTYTPTFADKPTAGVAVALASLRARGVPVRVARAGDRLAAGELTLDVLHPPAAGPAGNENARSLVLLLRHAGHTLLLSGDLEGPGLDRVLALAPPRVDVLMAPHHGSPAANTPALAGWARPRLVIACQGPPRSPARRPDPYGGAPVLGTWPHGAVTVRSSAAGLWVETFQTGQRLAVLPPSGG